MLQQKIDLAVIFRVTKANPNGDPLNGNRPRTDYDGFGEVSDVCIKRKIRDRLQEHGHTIFVQSADRNVDGEPSLRARAESEKHGLGKNMFKANKKEQPSRDKIAKAACDKWLDVRAFGQLFAFKDKEGKNSDESEDGEASVSVGVRGPVTIQSAFSIEPVSQFVTSIQITKSVSGEGDGSKRGSDTMGMKHRVDRGVYVFFGSMNPQLAERTGFNDADAEAIKQVLPRLFENDASSARPEGSMEVCKVIWWKHNCKTGQYPSAKVHRTLSVKPDGSYELARLDGLTPEELNGF